MSKTLQLHIPVPCHENWDKMSAQQQGRFCLSCQKTVVDFTTMTDEQILSFFKIASSRTCGRFSTDQLNRNLVPAPQRSLGWFKYFIHFIIPALLVSSKSYAQGEVSNKPVVCSTRIQGDTTIMPIKGEVKRAPATKTIAGRVVDTQANPLPGVTIMIKGTRKGTVTDAQGNFNIDAKSSDHLVALYAGYSSYEWTVDENLQVIPLTIVLDAMMMGDIRITALPKRKPTIFHDFKKKVSDSLSGSRLTVYPNPLTIQSRVTVEYSCRKSGNYTIGLLDVNGKLVQIERVNVESKLLRKEIAMNKLFVAGTYMIQIVDPSGKRVATQKVIISD